VSPTRVLSVIHGPAFGGTHNQLLRLHRPLRERGFETIAALPADGAPAAARLEAGGVEVHRVALGRLRASPDPALQLEFLRRLPGDLRRLAGLAAATGAEIVQVHGIQHPQAALAARRAAPPSSGSSPTPGRRCRCGGR
jgi:hypothetical protein